MHVCPHKCVCFCLCMDTIFIFSERIQRLNLNHVFKTLTWTIENLAQAEASLDIVLQTTSYLAIYITYYYVDSKIHNPFVLIETYNLISILKGLWTSQPVEAYGHTFQSSEYTNCSERLLLNWSIKPNYFFFELFGNQNTLQLYIR